MTLPWTFTWLYDVVDDDDDRFAIFIFILSHSRFFSIRSFIILKMKQCQFIDQKLQNNIDKRKNAHLIVVDQMCNIHVTKHEWQHIYEKIVDSWKLNTFIITLKIAIYAKYTVKSILDLNSVHFSLLEFFSPLLCY